MMSAQDKWIKEGRGGDFIEEEREEEGEECVWVLEGD